MQAKDLQIAKQACGPKASSYLARKHRGGNAGGDGLQYETWYAIYKIAKLVKAFDTDSRPPNLVTQSPDFVDDLVIQRPDKSHNEHFQLKNSASVSWVSGAHSISDDFLLQKKLNNFKGLNTLATLVLSCKDKAKKLNSTIPEEIASFSTVELFAFGKTLNHTLQLEPRLFNALADLCVNSDFDKIEMLGRLLAGVWVSKSGNVCSLNELWEGVLQHEPNYIRTSAHFEVLEKFQQILMQIDGFSYSIKRGYFDWSYMSYDSGILEHPIESEKFSDFQQTIITEAPSTFEELERHLI